MSDQVEDASRGLGDGEPASPGRRSMTGRRVLAAIGAAVLAVAALGGIWVKTRGVSFQPLFRETLRPGEFGTVAIASPETALTFAREAAERAG